MARIGSDNSAAGRADHLRNMQSMTAMAPDVFGTDKRERMQNIGSLLKEAGFTMGTQNSYGNGDFNKDGVRDLYFNFSGVNVYLDGKSGAVNTSAYDPKTAYLNGLKPW